MPIIVFWHHCYLALRTRSGSRSKVEVKVTVEGQRSGLKVKVKDQVKVPGQGQSQISGVQSVLGSQLCWVQQRAKKSNYQSKVFVCASNNHAGAVNRLLILLLFWLDSNRKTIAVLTLCTQYEPDTGPKLPENWEKMSRHINTSKPRTLDLGLGL